MKKRILAALIAGATVLALAGCDNNNNSSDNGGSSNSGNSGAGSSNSDGGNNGGADEGKKLRIACWNYEMAEWFDTYYKDKIPSDVTVEWVQHPNADGVYQQNLDRYLANNESASADDKIDLFLAEADYIAKYTNSGYSLNVKDLKSDINTSNTYKYILDAATDNSGNLKGVSPQGTPSGFIVRKSIAKDVLGVDTADEIQAKLDTWDKFNAVAKQAKDKGYIMTGSITTLWRVYAASAKTAWLDSNNKFAPIPEFNQWFAQAKDFMANGYSIAGGNWADEVTNEMMKDGKCMTYIGPMWYYAFNMNKAFNDSETGSNNDWLFIQGPQAHFWGGTWMLAAKGTDNPTLCGQILNDLLNDEDFLLAAAEGRGIKKRSEADGTITSEDKYNPLFPSNKNVVAKLAADSSKGFAGLADGQNDFAVQSKIADGIVWTPSAHTAYDQTFNEGLFDNIIEIWTAGVSEEQAWNNFYEKLATVVPDATH